MNVKDATDTAADSALIAALLEIVDVLGVDTFFGRGGQFSAIELAECGRIPVEQASNLLTALSVAKLVDRVGSSEMFRPAPKFGDLCNQADGLPWSNIAYVPGIKNVHKPQQHSDPAIGKGVWDGKRLAVSSKWAGTSGLSGLAVSAILERQPRRIVDLGAGTSGRLVRILRRLPKAHGTALDMSPRACNEARRAAARSGLADRVNVLTRGIESLTEDASPLEGADIVHASFVLHEVVALGASLDETLRVCHEYMSQDGRLIVIDAIPFAARARERAYSALFTYLQSAHRALHLPTEEQWIDSFQRAGFSDINVVSNHMPGSRLFIASR